VSTPIHIGSRRELLVDDFLIESLDGATFRLHHPTEQTDAFTCDAPWEGDWSGSATFIQDGDRYLMYYRGSTWPGVRQPYQFYQCYAESDDGINWTRPELGIIEFEGSKANNIVVKKNGAFEPFLDTNPDCHPDQRFKALTANGVLHAWSSPDGIRWVPMRDEPVITHGKFDSQNVAFWDATRGQYVAYYRAMRGPNDEMTEEGPQLGIDPNGPARDVMTCTSTDFLNWTEPQWLEYPGAPPEQIYLNQIRAYHRAPHIFVGFPGRFVAGREIEKGLPTTEHPAYETANVTETLFMSSRDGLHFKRWGEAFIRPGPRWERWIYAATFPEYGLLVTKSAIEGAPDELSLYVHDGGSWAQRGTATRWRRYTLRMDGFVSVNAPLNGGTLITKPFIFHGRALTMNYATSAAGSIQVELQDPEGQPLPGFELTNYIFGDQIDGPITWEGANLRELSGRPVRLRVVLKDADLFSLQFTE
tara:strand:- start:1042 stop:2463 length:1422 start_codon:yes stop_codon:yes gene_type:complete